MSVIVTLALGANLGDPPGQLATAVELLSDLVTIDCTSDVYLTEPVGILEQPDFYNMVVAGRTDLAVYALHAGLQRIEDRVGRVPSVRNGPRALDIDILTYGELVLSSPRLTLPHPRIAARAFVLVPLRDACPGWVDPVNRSSAAALLAGLPDQGGVRRLGEIAKLLAAR